MRNHFPVAKYNYLVKSFVLCTLTLEEAKKAAKNVIHQGRFDVTDPKYSYWNYGCVIRSFIWFKSDEGYDYWSKVSNRLFNNARKA